jgi:hypothetical protein
LHGRMFFEDSGRKVGWLWLMLQSIWIISQTA